MAKALGVEGDRMSPTERSGSLAGVALLTQPVGGLRQHDRSAIYLGCIEEVTPPVWSSELDTGEEQQVQLWL